MFFLFVGYILNLMAWPLYEQYTLFSNWTMHFTTVSIIMTYMAIQSVNFKNSKWAIFINHIFYSFAIPFNMITVCLYWNLIHAKTIEKHRADGPWYKVVCQYWIHIVPAISCLTNTVISNIVLSRKPIKIQTTFGFCYCMLNFGVTRLRGHPIYSFMPWDTFADTFLVVIMLLAFYASSFLVLCFIDEALKP